MRVKREKVEAEEDRDEYEEGMKQQTLFTDFLQQKIDELKALALASADVDHGKVHEIVSRVWTA